MAHDVFSFLDERGRRQVAALAVRLVLARDEFLFQADDPGEDVFFLAEGRLSVLKRTGFHHKMQGVAILEPGAVVGEAAVIAGHVRSTSVRAIEPCLLFSLSRPAFDELARLESGVFAALLQRLLWTASLRLEKAAARLAHVL